MPWVNPQILAWARESAGLPLADAARAIGLAGDSAAVRLAEMELGERAPTRPQLLKMAERYRRPLLTFYLPTPPAIGERTHDFRTLPEQEGGSEAVLEALVRIVKARQSLVLSALEDAEEIEPLAFVGSVDSAKGADELSKAIYASIKFDRAAYRAARTLDDAIRMLRDAIEGAGVYVLLMGNLGHHTTNLSPSVFRGMALADPVAPFIVISLATYRQLAGMFDQDRLEYAQRAPNAGAPDYYVVRRHRVGRGLLELINRMVAGGALTTTKAGKVLGVKPTAVGHMTEAVA